ncbi:hypothetical protein SS50377_27460 [Spironucleus salmonicida]|uniref:Uncharacterized protein n=1 Tax=Spironucleus salmonicida TaxID=348837 RepID=V6LFD8_9EUKA|nr:hypothetical protein SS50377_27460 [Spironucleus salmonicida]|eukprot:EST43250.1 Hypothetical protein SS50377_16915 [Spironucleus salmonicida]
MAEKNIRSDLLIWMKNSVFNEIKSRSRFPKTIDFQVIQYIYKDLVTAESEKNLQDILGFIFELKKDDCDKIFQFITAKKKEFQEYLTSPNSFYDNPNEIETFSQKMCQSTKPSCTAQELYSCLQTKPILVPLKRPALIAKKYDKNYKNMFSIQINLNNTEIQVCQKASIIATQVLKFGCISSVFDFQGNIIAQFQGFEPILAISFHLEQFLSSINCQKANIDAIFQQKTENLIIDQSDNSLYLKKLPLPYQKDGIFTLDQINFTFIKNVYLTQNEDEICLQFGNTQSRFTFTKLTKLDDLGIQVQLIQGELNIQGMVKIIKQQLDGKIDKK